MQIGNVSPNHASSPQAARIAAPQGTPPQGVSPRASAHIDSDGDKDGSTSAAPDSGAAGKQVNVLA